MGDPELSPPGGDKFLGSVSSRREISQKYLPSMPCMYLTTGGTMNSRGDKILGVRLAPKGGDNQKIGEIVRGHPLY